jgi:acetyl esterase/lipase
VHAISTRVNNVRNEGSGILGAMNPSEGRSACWLQESSVMAILSRSSRRLWRLVAAGVFLASGIVSASEPQRGIEFARVGETVLQLDLYRPDPDRRDAPPPLIVWVHGGAWRAGSREDVPIRALVEQGYAIASIDYRLSTTARFPAQVHDIKAAIRFVRAKAADWSCDPDRLIIAGASAGGHLAALAGVSHGLPQLEGTVGKDLDQSTAVQAIVSFYGASNLQTILAQSTPHGLRVREPALEMLLGGLPNQQPDLARLASPVAHVDPHDPPLLLLHGDQDPQMPINQAHELEGAYQKVDRPVEFIVVHGAAHGGPAFYTPEMLERLRKFLDRQGAMP